MPNALITCAPTGAIHAPSMSPFLPVAPEARHGAASGTRGNGRCSAREPRRSASGTLALAMSASAWVGLEDSLWDGPGMLAESSRAQVDRIRVATEALYRDLATPAEASGRLGLHRAMARRGSTEPAMATCDTRPDPGIYGRWSD